MNISLTSVACSPNSERRFSLFERRSSILPLYRSVQRHLRKSTMISILAQERLLGFALGSVLTGVVIFEQRRDIYRTIERNQPRFAPKSQMKEPRSRFEFAHYWNKTVDQIFGPAIQALSSRGW